MKDRRAITAFYVETLLMIVVFIGIMMVLTRILVLSKMQEKKAQHLTEAVTVAANVAEALSASDEIEEAIKVLDLEEGAFEKPGRIYAGTYRISKEGKDDTLYKVRITKTEEGKIAHHLIEIFTGNEKDPVYQLTTDQSTGSIRKGAAA